MPSRWAASHPAAAHLFVPALEAELGIGGDVGHHLDRVRRLRAGESVTAADGAGRWRPYVVREARRGSLRLEATGAEVVEPTLTPRLAVAFALTKGAKPDVTVQKLTELGIDRILPLRAHRSVRRWDADRAVDAVARLRAIAREAAAQSRRASLPAVEMPRDLDGLSAHPGLVVADAGGVPPAEVPSPAGGEWLLVVGPEGGFEPEELATLVGRTKVRLGPHVLRAETAAIAGAAALAGRRAPDR